MKLYIFDLPVTPTTETYDQTALAVCLQGIFNRESDCDRIYMLSDSGRRRPKYWLDLFTANGGWMAKYKREKIADLNALIALTLPYIKRKIIWDPAVPATVNAAFTIAGVEDGAVLSPELDAALGSAFAGLPVTDLRGRFNGSVTGSAKNDVYRWAISEYLAKGKCSKHFLCLYEDSAGVRGGGGVGYAVTRDWAVYNRAFVYDLSPWGDEVPEDDPTQPLGCDLETYRIMLSEQLKQTGGEQMTEVAGFFNFWKYSNIEGHPHKHDPVPTEWETVWVISEYNCYQNTVASDCYNQSFHSQYGIKQLKQGKPEIVPPLENKVYVCIHMADYDSMTPLYDFLPSNWDNNRRGAFPCGWGINPNLCETYPDIFEHLYKTKTPNDWFVADASAAGYFNPNRIREHYWDMVTAHNKKFYELCDMTISPMVLDWDEPTARVKDEFSKFSPDGFSTIVMDMHENGGHDPVPHVWKDGMVVDWMYNGACNWLGRKQTAEVFASALAADKTDRPNFHMIRMVWMTPEMVEGVVTDAKKLLPGLKIELVDPYTYFRLEKEYLSGK